MQTIALKGKAGKLDHLALDGKRERLFLANTANGTLDVVDLKAGKLLKQVTGQTGIQGVAYAADLDRVFVGLGTGGLCNVFDGPITSPSKPSSSPTTPTTSATTRPASWCSWPMPRRRWAWSTPRRSRQSRHQAAGRREGFQIAAGKPQLYLVIPSPSQLVVIDTDKKSRRHHPINWRAAAIRWPWTTPTSASLSVVARPRRSWSWTASPARKSPACRSPRTIDDLFYDAKRKRLYASCGEGFLVAIKQMDADNYEATEKIPTVKGAKTSLFDADTGRLFLAVPRQSGKSGPEIRVYRVKD